MPKTHDTSSTAGSRCRLLTDMGDNYAALGNAGRAADCYRQSLAAAAGNPTPHVRLGTLALQDDRVADAMRSFAAAIELDADCAEAYGGLAMVYQRQGRLSSAFEMYLACLERDTDNLAALLGLFQTSCRMGSFGKIIHFLELYLDRHPDDASVLFCLASLYVREGRASDARETLQRALALEPDKPEAAELLAEVERRLAATPPTAGPATELRLTGV